MSGSISFVIKEIKGSAYLFLLAGVLYIGPIFLVSEPLKSTNTGLVPFLLAPFILAVFVPQLSVLHEGVRASLFVRCSLFLVFTGLIFLATFLFFGTPRPVAGLKGVVFLTSFAVLLIGLAIFVQGLGTSSFVARWCSTVIGLLLVGSFVYLSPLADHFYNAPGLRNLVIAFATRANPVLAMSGGILGQDLLRGAFLYEHLSIGRYYSYSAPSWLGLTLGYAASGVITGASGWFLHPRHGRDGDT